LGAAVFSTVAVLEFCACGGAGEGEGSGLGEGGVAAAAVCGAGARDARPAVAARGEGEPRLADVPTRAAPPEPKDPAEAGLQRGEANCTRHPNKSSARATLLLQEENGLGLRIEASPGICWPDHRQYLTAGPNRFQFSRNWELAIGVRAAKSFNCLPLGSGDLGEVLDAFGKTMQGRR
jgi:hypothetical protein